MQRCRQGRGIVLLEYYCISIDVLLSLVQGELVKIRLFHESIQAGSLPHRLFTIPGTNLLPLSALQVAHVDPVESSYRVKLENLFIRISLQAAE